eukprot:9467932-Pyramimonas_sp.AAC.2
MPLRLPSRRLLDAGTRPVDSLIGNCKITSTSTTDMAMFHSMCCWAVKKGNMLSSTNNYV